jgi:hypothetical protein
LQDRKKQDGQDRQDEATLLLARQEKNRMGRIGRMSSARSLAKHETI